MSISQLRRRVDALKRRFALELAIIKLRRIAQDISDNWIPSEPTDPARVIDRIVKAGFRLDTFVRLRRYLDDIQREGAVPNPNIIVRKLLPWAEHHRYDELFRWDLPAPEASPRLPRHWL